MFGTMIANLQSPKISTVLLLGQRSKDCLDLIAKIFKFKYHVLIKDICKHYILKHALPKVHTIEF